MDLRQTFALANEFKEGDLLVGGTRDPRVRDDARRSLAALRVGEITSAAFVDDGVSEAIERSLDRQALANGSSPTTGALKQLPLQPAARRRGAPHWAGVRAQGGAGVRHGETR